MIYMQYFIKSKVRLHLESIQIYNNTKFMKTNCFLNSQCYKFIAYEKMMVTCKHGTITSQM